MGMLDRINNIIIILLLSLIVLKCFFNTYFNNEYFLNNLYPIDPEVNALDINNYNDEINEIKLNNLLEILKYVKLEANDNKNINYIFNRANKNIERIELSPDEVKPIVKLLIDSINNKL